MFRESTATVRMLGRLHSLRRERGLESVTEVGIPAKGCSARELASILELPVEKIEAVFVNHRAYDLSRTVRAGDRVAFVPTGIPSTERLLLGICRPG